MTLNEKIEKFTTQGFFFIQFCVYHENMNDNGNLISLGDRTMEERRNIARKAGRASGETRRKKRDLKSAMQILLESDLRDECGKVLSGAEAIALAQFKKALQGDQKSFELVRDTAGQKPVEKTVNASVPPEVIADIEQMLEDAKK